VPLELAELAAGLPVAASFAMAGGISVLREGRRRSALNEAVHELRRPLQAIALATSDSVDRAPALESSLRMAAAAVDRLDREINGGPSTEAVDRVDLRRLVDSAVERWRTRALLEGRAVRLDWAAGEPGLHGDPLELARAVDNLISNGLEHGGGDVAVEVSRAGRGIRLAVLNHERPGEGTRSWSIRSFRLRLTGRERHGHGLRIVRRVAASHGGGFRMRRRGGLREARLELPGGSR